MKTTAKSEPRPEGRGRVEAAKPRSHEATKGTGAIALEAYRARQKSVADILDGTFGPLADTDQSLWGRRAYLMLVGMVYERLAIGEDELPMDELVALAKILAENRRAENQKNESTAFPGSASDPTQTLESVVRELYGLTLSPSPPAA